MKDYYKILGISRTASQAEAKRAFRKLAVIYHPDKNPDPAAEQFFKEVNEAYDVIGDPEKRRDYDFRFVNAFTAIVQTPSPPRHRDPAYRRKRPPGPRPKTERQKIAEMIEHYAPFSRKLILAAFCVSVFLMFDFLLPKRASLETVTTGKTSGKGMNEHWEIIHTNKHVLVIPRTFPRVFAVGNKVSLRSSLFLNIPVRIETNSASVRIYKTIYSNFIFMPIALAITSALGMRNRKHPEKAFNYALVSLAAMLLTFILFLILH